MFIKSYTLIRYLKVYLMNSCVDTSLTSVEELELAELIQLTYHVVILEYFNIKE